MSPPCDLFDHDGGRYLLWLDSKPVKSVVYISFGSSSVMSKRQVAEIADAMGQLKKPFHWLLRKDNCKDQEDAAAIKEMTTAAATGNDDNRTGLVVEWCDQARVLSHPSVACFVTHCGWNSALEATACGVPLVATPQYLDQGTGAWLVEDWMGTGVRCTESGIVRAGELVRSVEAATSEAVAARAVEWTERAWAAVADGGSWDRNLKDFLRQIDDGGN